MASVSEMPTPPISSAGTSGPDTSSGPSPSASKLSPAPPGHICVSTTFYPGAPLIPNPAQTAPPAADIVLYAVQDQVYFYVHSALLLERSMNQFGFLLSPPPQDDYAYVSTSTYGTNSIQTPGDMGFVDPTQGYPNQTLGLYHPGPQASTSRPQFLQSPPPSEYLRESSSGDSEPSGSRSASSSNAPSPLKPRNGSNSPSPRFITINDSAEIINLLLHAVYGIPAERYYPSLELLSQLPAILRHYGYTPEAYIGEHSLMTQLFLNHAREGECLEVYALAGAYELEYLAQRASRAALSFPLTALTDSQIVRMGSTYLRRLINLHVNRVSSLKNILLVPPEGHPKGPSVPPCDGTEDRILRAWAFATAYLAWEAKPDLPNVVIAQSLAPLLDHVHCPECKQRLQHRISTVLNTWAMVKDTI